MDERSQQVGRNIKRLREARSLSQADLAAKLTARGVAGMHPQTITKIEAGSRALKFIEALEVARVLGADVGALDLLDDDVLARYSLNDSANSVIHAAQAAQEAMAKFIGLRAGLEKDIKRARASGVEPDRWAKIAQSMTINSIIQNARAALAAEAESERVRYENRGPGLYVSDYVDNPEQPDGEHREAP